MQAVHFLPVCTETQAIVSLRGLFAWLVYLTWNGIGSRLAHQISHQEFCCCEPPQQIMGAGLSPLLHYDCAEACLSVCMPRSVRQTMSTCFTSLQAAERGGSSEENSNSATLPDCSGLGTNPAMGQLPELLPAVLMSHQAFQQLQLQLLPFQVCRQQGGLSHALHVPVRSFQLTVSHVLYPPAFVLPERFACRPFCRPLYCCTICACACQIISVGCFSCAVSSCRCVA